MNAPILSLHVVRDHPSFAALGLLLLAIVGIFLLPGCSWNGRPMRFDPATAGVPKGASWFVEGSARNGAAISCSFVEFDERGDFLDFQQHIDCQARIKALAESTNVLLLIYCHGWKNSSQSGDVTHFNAFLAKLAETEEVQRRGLRVHGVYLGWRGNVFKPYVDRGPKNQSYQDNLSAYGQSIVDCRRERGSYWMGAIPETLSYWNRKGAAEYKVSGLPMARAIFTYAATAKGYGTNAGSRVCVMGHSFGALMLEQSLGHAMTGALTMEWWNHEKVKLPFDFVLFVNSAAPAIYAKEMRDFLEAYRRGLGMRHSPDQDVPVIVSVTSTADWATGLVHPIGNMCAPFAPSLKRRYTSGILSNKGTNSVDSTHDGIRQSEFYTRTPGHQRYLINHWIVKADQALLPADTTPASIFSANLSTTAKDRDLFFTSKAKFPATAWRLTNDPPVAPAKSELAPAMPNSDYWIVTCDKELIGGHNDIWSPTAMEMYAGLYRAVQARRGRNEPPERTSR